MVGEKIGQIECTRLAFGLLVEELAAIELVTVRAGDADGVGIAGEQGIQRADGAAVGIADEDAVEAAGPVIELFRDGRGDAFGTVMQLGGDGGQLVVPTPLVGDGDQFRARWRRRL